MRTTLVLWALQGLLPGSLLVYVFLRYRLGVALGPLWVSAALLSAIWIALVFAVVATPAGRGWLHRRSRELLLLGTVGLLMALLGDVTLTATGAVPTMERLHSKYSLQYRSGALTLGRLQPNQVLELEGRPPLSINSRGYRGPEVQLPKPPGLTRVVFLGGSQVFDPDGADWTQRVGERLSSPSRPVDVINAGVPSHRTADSIGKCLGELWMWSPDVLVVCQAWNDIKYFPRLTPATPYVDLFQPRKGDWGRRLSPLDRILGPSALYRVVHLGLLRVTHADEGEARRTANEVVQEWGIRQFQLNLELLCDLGRNIGAQVVLCKQARQLTSEDGSPGEAGPWSQYIGISRQDLLTAFRECDAVIEEVAHRKGAEVIDLHSAFSDQPEYFSDHIHFSQAGSDAVGRFVAAELERVLASPPERASTVSSGHETTETPKEEP